MESTAPGRAGEAVRDGGRSQAEKEKERLHSEEAGLAAILNKAVNYVHLYEKEEGGRRRYRGHLLITNKGNKNLLGPKFAELDEEGDGYYLTGRRHFYLKEANEDTGNWYLLCGKVYPVIPEFDREPKFGFQNVYCPICGAVPNSLISCQKEKANVCDECCGRCPHNISWRCNYKKKSRHE